MNALIEPPVRARWITWAQFLTVVLIWGTTWIVIRSQLEMVPPSWSVAYRFVVATAAVVAFCLLTRRPLAISASGHRFAAIAGVFQFAVNFQLVYRAEQHVTSGLVAVVFALLLVPNSLLAWAAYRSHISWRFAGGAALGIAGVALLFRHEFLSGGGPDALLGLALTAGGVLAASVANVMQASPAGRRLPPFATLAWMLGYGCLANIAVAALIAGPPVWDPWPGYAAGILFLGVLGSAVAFALYYDLIRRLGPGPAAYTSVVIPMVALAFSTALEGYRWSGAAVGGAALALTGLVIALRARR